MKHTGVFAGSYIDMNSKLKLKVLDIFGWLCIGLILVTLADVVGNEYFDVNDKKFIFALGFIAMWRYTNALIHFCRGMYFLYYKFPKVRKAVDEIGADAMPPEMFIVVTSFRIPSDTTFKVYQSVFKECNNLDMPVTVVVSIVEKGDERLIKETMKKTVEDSERVKLVIIRARGTGKRDGLGHAFRAVSRCEPQEGSVVGVVDGDTLLVPGCVEKAVSVFSVFPSVGGVTTDEYCTVRGSFFSQQWHAMRFVQRHINMCSMSLSKRVLTMTGRLSFFRANLLTSKEFINDVSSDYLDHWRLGRFKFLTGDDKSSWFSLMKSGWDTYYVPDSKTLTVEDPPSESFFKSTVVLMFRWYGNSLRQNFRAFKYLGRKRLGNFASYVLLDQRVSMWTSLLGLSVTLVASLVYDIKYLFVYVFWVLLTRSIVALSFLSSGHYVGSMYPLALYYNQIVGSVVKVYALFHLDKQSWTRQKTVLAKSSDKIDCFMNIISSKAMLISSISIFFSLVGLIISYTD
ncbi:MAG: glycosyltransferase [Porticoccus sp.]|nr:glycosyltransferase [Porticoccus sp.]MBQ0808530.1 glycosyltransferase [Porticoccus sp.]MDX2369443.1 glycosyltransferase [Colwellia sp.]